MKYYILTYGCQMNNADSERIAVALEKKGHKPASEIKEAGLVVVNMCSVRQSAVDRIFGLDKKLKELKTINYKLKTILTGCVLKKDKNKFRKVFDEVVNIKDFIKKAKPKYLNDFSALVPIMTGCNNFCAYCVVPYIRGKEFSRPAKEIICETKNLVKKGYKEIWLLGQNVNSYKSSLKATPETSDRLNCESKTEINFPQLLKKINNIPGKFWIRFTSSHPKDFSNELIKVMAECEKVTEYLNLPVQAGDDKILKKMNRPYTITYYKNLVRKIRKKIPNITLSTDVIIGFPGETKKQFENTIKLFKEIKFDMAYIAKYSPRPGTAAAKLKDNVSSEEKKRREKVLTKILKKTALGNNRKYVGKIETVLPSEHKDGFLIGKSFHYKTVKFRGKKNLIGKFVKVKIIDALPWGLKGQII